jgi:hypothetical protein
MLTSTVAGQVVVLGCKASIAVLLLAAGGAKLADLPGFASTVRLFTPASAAGWFPASAAPVIAAGELAAGAASLAMPRAGWINPIVVAICGSFLVVWIAGFARHRGRSCQCFGGLSHSVFSGAGIGRAAGLVLAAGVALLDVPQQAVALSMGGQLGLLAIGVLIAVAAFSAAAATGGRREGARWA